METAQKQPRRRKNPGGRPPAAEPLRKWSFRATDRQRRLIEDAARITETSVSEFIRSAAIGAAQRELGK